MQYHKFMTNYKNDSWQHFIILLIQFVYFVVRETKITCNVICIADVHMITITHVCTINVLKNSLKLIVFTQKNPVVAGLSYPILLIYSTP